MGTLKPYVISEDARTQAAFYVQALNGEIVSAITHGEAMGAKGEFENKVLHMCLSLAGGNHFFMADMIEPFAYGTGISISLEFPDESEARAAFGRLAEGGKVKYPFEFQPFGIFLGELTDKFGVVWMITAEPKA